MTTAAPEAPRRRLDRGIGIAIAIVIFLGAFLVFKASPNHEMYDSQFTMLLADNLLRHGDFRLERYRIPETVLVGERIEPQYRFERVRGHLYYRFPPGGALLSVPYVAVMRAAGLSVVRADGSYDQRAEGRLNATLAALVAAGFAALVFFTARLLLPLHASVAVAVVAALGTQIYSSASRALGSDTWGIFLIAAAIFVLLRSRTRQQPANGILLGTLVSWAYIVRPTNSLALIGIAVLLAFDNRRTLALYTAAATVWIGLLVAYSLAHFGQVLPGYFLVQRLGEGTFAASLLGHLVSPSRGLLLYAPALVLGVVLAIRYRKQLRAPALARLALGLTVAHLLVLAHYRGWGGHTYGPRLSTGAVPWLVLLGILGIDAARRARPGGMGWGAVLGAGAIGCLSIVLNGIGAVSHAAVLWNSEPVDVDLHSAWVWDWRRPQALAPFVKAGDPYLPIPRAGIQMGTTDAGPYLAPGWSYAEREFRWTDGPAAAIRFLGPKPVSDGLLVELSPLLIPGEVDRQHIDVALNDRPLWTDDLSAGGFSVVFIPISDGLVEQGRNTLKFLLPNATVPPAEKQAGRDRHLGLAVRSIRWADTRMIPDAGILVGATDAATDATPYLRSGWSGPEGDFRWTDGPTATIRFAGERPPPEILEIDLRPYLVPGKIDRQRIEARVNGRPIWNADIVNVPFERHLIPLPPGSITAENNLTLSFPDATSPRSLGQSDDNRKLAFAVRSIRHGRNRFMPELRMGDADADAGIYLGSGWAKAERDTRWTDGPVAMVTFPGEGEAADAIAIELRPFLVAGKVGKQRIRLSINGLEMWAAELTTPEFTRHVIPVPAGVVHGENVLKLFLPDAVSPRSVTGSPDDRRLGVAVRTIHRARNPW